MVIGRGAHGRHAAAQTGRKLAGKLNRALPYQGKFVMGETPQQFQTFADRLASAA